LLDLRRDRLCSRAFDVDPGSLPHVEDTGKPTNANGRVNADAGIETYDHGGSLVLLNRIFHRAYLSALFVHNSTHV